MSKVRSTSNSTPAGRRTGVSEGPDCPALGETYEVPTESRESSEDQSGQNISHRIRTFGSSVQDGPDCPALPEPAGDGGIARRSVRQADWNEANLEAGNGNTVVNGSHTVLNESQKSVTPTKEGPFNSQHWPGPTANKMSNILFPVDPDIVPKYGPLGVRALVFTPSWFSINV